jgi:putative transposase
MLKAYKYRIYPNHIQRSVIDNHIGACRFIYNLALQTKLTAYSGTKHNLSCFDLHKQLPELKKECIWLNEINSQSLQSAISNMDRSFQNFLKGISSFPKYKSKRRGNNSFHCPQGVKMACV